MGRAWWIGSVVAARLNVGVLHGVPVHRRKYELPTFIIQDVLGPNGSVNSLW
jgi:hypothetical protein